MGVRQWGAGRRRTTWGDSVTSSGKRYSVWWWSATRIGMESATSAQGSQPHGPSIRAAAAQGQFILSAAAAKANLDGEPYLTTGLPSLILMQKRGQLCRRQEEAA